MGDAKINFYGYGSFDNPDDWKQICNKEAIKQLEDVEGANMVITIFCTGRIINEGWEMNY